MLPAKQHLNINFSQGLDTKTDPFQVSAGRFLSLSNTVFDKAGRLTKRSGFGSLSQLPDTSTTFLTTFNGNLTAIGDTLEAYSAATSSWVNKGVIQSIQLSTLPLIRSTTNQSQADSAVAPNGLVCTVFTDNIPSGGSTTPVYKYVVADSLTGQNIIAPTVVTSSGATVTGSQRVFVLGNYFIIVLSALFGSTYHLQYIAISTNNPTAVKPATDISTEYTPETNLSFDGFVVANQLYLAWNGSDGGGAIRMTALETNLGQRNTIIVGGFTATEMTVTGDLNNSCVYVSFYNSGDTTAHTFATDFVLNLRYAPVLILTQSGIANIVSAAQNQVCTVFFEVVNAYGYDSSIPTHYIQSITITQTGTVGSLTPVSRSVGLASKAFISNGTIYLLSIYYSLYQPSYFLLDSKGNVGATLAYSNAGTYSITGLPSITNIGDVYYCAYFFKDLIQAVNKAQGVVNTAGIYSQTGINLVNFTINSGNQLVASEIGKNLNLSGGFLRGYDGYEAVENGFFLWPDNVEVTSSTGGSMTAQQYFYQCVYEWADNQGNAYRSAPSVPVSITLTSGTSVIIDIPTIRLTYKTANPVKITVYRWSVGQQNYYETTSILVPLFNDKTVDYVTFTDNNSDAQILGNALIYTTGGVIEDIAGPASSVLTLFNNRLFLVDAEDKNLLWYSKQVIENTPVEMSDLLTLYVSPTTSAQGSTGTITALAALDDKLIIFKKDAIYYINGIGPDNTGANSQYSDATFITATVGCANQQSIVFMPNGLMFQSDKGIWLLGRDLSTNYIGAAVESLTIGATVLSSVNVPATNQVRFTLSTGITLMYDYYFAQWGSFSNIPAVSSTLYQNLHTYVNARGIVAQETPGIYVDIASPVLMSFTTSWINLAGVQGFERFYQMLLLGTFLSPFTLAVSLAYDYNPVSQQNTTITPSNYSPPWGGDPAWGSSEVWGGPSYVFEERLFPQIQKCESFQITINEVYDASFGVAPGAGLTLSGMNILVGIKKGSRTSPASQNFG